MVCENVKKHRPQCYYVYCLLYCTPPNFELDTLQQNCQASNPQAQTSFIARINSDL